MAQFQLLIRDADQLVCVCSHGEKCLRGPAQGNITIIEHGSMIVGMDGKIVAVGPAKEIEEKFKGATFVTDFDARGKSVVPGLVDAHTHPVWSGDRVHEFEMKLAGATYLDIHKAGGGIAFTVSFV